MADTFRPIWIPLFWGVLLRLVWAWVVPVHPVSDSGMYWTFAQNIANGVGYAFEDGSLTAYWPVGTSAIYAFCIWLFGPDFSHVVALNLCIAVASMVLTYVLAIQCGLSQRVATGAVWIMALWPLQIQFSTIIASEMLFNAFMLAALVSWLHGARWRWLAAALFAVSMTIAVYVRPTALPLLLAVPLIGLWVHRDVVSFLLKAVVVAVVSAALFLPWVNRNIEVMGHPVLVSTNFGPNLWMGNNPDTNGGYMPLKKLPFANEHERDVYYKQEAIAYIKSNPAEFLKNSVRRLVMTYDRESIGVHWNMEGIRSAMGERALAPLKIWALLYWWVVFGAGLLGVTWMFLQSPGKEAVLVVCACCSLFFIVPILTVGQDRYHAPLIPFLAIGASLMLVSVLRRWEDRAVNSA